MCTTRYWYRTDIEMHLVQTGKSNLDLNQKKSSSPGRGIRKHSFSPYYSSGPFRLPLSNPSFADGLVKD
ncbi:hypothetical protein GW17_00037009 [Ensete ventricosum]|nr:hypothetical protein GW17_00037009 [Ensete ventricosum]